MGLGVRCMLCILLEGVLPLPARLILEGPGTALVLRRLILLYTLLPPPRCIILLSGHSEPLYGIVLPG